MRRTRSMVGVALLALIMAAGGCSSNDHPSGPDFIVTSLADDATPPARQVTLRSAIESAQPGDTIGFDSALDGQTIVLTNVGEEHSVLKGEVYVNNAFSGYQERDYGRSALYAHKDLTIDASDLPNGIRLEWGGGASSHARVLAVYGDLTMKNVTVASGYSEAVTIDGGSQPYTLARGGGLAVWGTAHLTDCVITGNACVGESGSARDRGTYGGGIFANGLDLEDCVISGNSVIAYGAGGGGIYSVGGGANVGGRGNDALLTRCTVSGNRVTAQHAYGGGIFTLSGGPDNLATMILTNCTVARNLLQDHPDFDNVGQWFDRGGGIYIGGGSLQLIGCTVAENAIIGDVAYFGGKPSAAGGGVGATTGNAHVIETVWLRNSIVVGNTLNGAPQDWFAGSLLDFFSEGYNIVGKVDFSWILVPVPDWMMASRRRWPKPGDQEWATLEQALDVAGAHYHATAISAGTDAGGPALLWYPPADLAVDKIPNQDYSVTYVNAGYTGFGVPTDDFLNYVILQCRSVYGAILGADFGSEFGDLTGTTWYESPRTWPSDPLNVPWINFWHNLDTAIGDRLGMVRLGDDFWGTFSSGPLGEHVSITVERQTRTFHMEGLDQLGTTRPRGGLGDIGAIER